MKAHHLHLLFAMFIPWAVGGGCDWPSHTQKLELSGTIEITEHAVGSRVSGTLTTLTVKEGDNVRKGQTLATLERYDQKKKDYERMLRLHESAGESEQSVELAKLAMEDQMIISPIDGVVLTKIKELGEVVSPGTPVLDLGDRSELWIRVFVPEGFINRIEFGQEAQVQCDGLRETFKGHVSYISTKAEFTPRNVQTPEERVTQAFAVKISLDHPPFFLRPGVAGDVSIHLKSQ